MRRDREHFGDRELTLVYVARRLKEHYADEIVWMRPSEIAAYRHAERHTALRAEKDGRAPIGRNEHVGIAILIEVPDGKAARRDHCRKHGPSIRADIA